MSGRLRIRFEGAFYHVFNRGANKQPIFSDDNDRYFFLACLGQYAIELKVRFFAYCLMENHYHFFLQTLKPNLDKFMQKLQAKYVRSFNKKYGRVGCLFQSRYQSPLVNTDSYSLSLARYIHRNPIEAGIVANLEDYPWSSYPDYLGRTQDKPWLDTNWLLSQFDSKLAEGRTYFKKYHELSEDIQLKPGMTMSSELQPNALS